MTPAYETPAETAVFWMETTIRCQPQIMQNPPTADLFTARTLDILDNGSLQLQCNRN